MSDSDTTPQPTSSQELVIALAGALGAQLEDVALELQLALHPYEYTAIEVRLSAGLRTVPGQIELPEQHYDERVDAYMDAGNALRKQLQRGDALALLAAREIAQQRAGGPSARRAFILRSLKHPAEVALLRAVYGERFLLVSAYSPRETRLAAVRRRIEDTWGSTDPTDWTFQPSQLLERDEHEAADFGQQLRETFPLADFFIDARDRERMRPQLERFIALLLGDPFRTPTQEEYALACAQAVSLRSAELGRQVGACLTSDDGEVIALGTNEVPRPGGGLYWEGDDGDAREFKLGVDTNDRRKREIAEEIVQALGDGGLLNRDGPPVEPTDLLDRVLGTQLGVLTEFGRAVHAEMAALLDAARRGVSVRGARLYTTTFPCHNCARHLIAAGVSEIVYVAPYAKSQAFRLHEDALVVAAAAPPADRLHLRPFVGVAPRLYGRLFAAGQRKARTGEVVPFDPAQALPLVDVTIPTELRPDRPGYLAREERAIAVLEGLLSEPAQSDDDDLNVYDDE